MKHNILFTSWYVGLGGGETDLLALTDHLDTERYTPHLMLPYTGQLSARWQESGWPVHVVPFRGATTYFIPQIWARFPAVNRIKQLIQSQNIHAVHSDYHSLPFVLPAAKALKIPVLWTCWGWWFKPKTWQRDFFRGVDAIFARSRAIKAGFLGDPPFMFADDIELVYSGVDTKRFNPTIDGTRVRFDAGMPQDVPVVVLIARFQDVKGHHTFQDMARQIALQLPEVRFVVAGEDVHQVAADAKYKRYIIERHQKDPLIQHRLRYIGFRDDVERVIAAADVVVCSSDFESYGRVNVEAMASGKPVVSTNRGGPSETILHGETGFLVEPGDASGLAKYVIELLKDSYLRQRFGRAGREHVLKYFSAESMAAPYMKQFDQWCRM